MLARHPVQSSLRLTGTQRNTSTLCGKRAVRRSCWERGTLLVAHHAGGASWIQKWTRTGGGVEPQGRAPAGRRARCPAGRATARPQWHTGWWGPPVSTGPPAAGPRGAGLGEEARWREIMRNGCQCGRCAECNQAPNPHGPTLAHLGWHDEVPVLRANRVTLPA